MSLFRRRFGLPPHPTSGTPLENGTLGAVVAAVVGEIDTRFTELYPNVENIQDIVEKHLVKNGL